MKVCLHTFKGILESYRMYSEYQDQFFINLLIYLQIGLGSRKVIPIRIDAEAFPQIRKIWPRFSNRHAANDNCRKRNWNKY